MVFLVEDILRKIKVSSVEWFQAQEIEKVEDARQHSVLSSQCCRWRPPPK
ncbi:unnamed protein product, partial [Arabidopsis halleri]